MRYKVGSFEFIIWRGVLPQLIKQHMLAFRKPGMNGITALGQGVNGDEFAASLTAVFQDDNSMRAAIDNYRIQIGNVLKIEYEGIDFEAIYATSHLVMDVQHSMMKKQAVSMGPGYCYYDAWHLVSDWRFIPVTTPEP